MNKQQTYHQLAREIRKVNMDNGWQTATWENLPAKLAMTFTEVAEAHKEFPQRPAFDLELADIAIRLLDVLSSVHEKQTFCVRTTYKDTESARRQTVGDTLWVILQPLSDALEAWRHDQKIEAMLCVEIALARCIWVAEVYDIPLVRAIQRKLDINRQRGMWHGKAQGVA